MLMDFKILSSFCFDFLKQFYIAPVIFFKRNIVWIPVYIWINCFISIRSIIIRLVN